MTTGTEDRTGTELGAVAPPRRSRESGRARQSPPAPATTPPETIATARLTGLGEE